MPYSIEVTNLTKVFHGKDGDVVAADHLNFRVEQGDIFGIIGLSGAGKSTVVRCLNLLEKPTEGEVVVEGKSMLSLPEKELRLARREIGMIFQGFNLLMQRTVLDNVLFSLEIAGWNRADAKKRAYEMLETVGLSDKAKAYPAQLSGGQKQRVAIARVLATNPKVILSDEATSALDPQTTKSILSLLKEINKKYGITIVLITHEMAVVQEICNHVLVLEKGRMAEFGEVDELFHNPKTEATKRLLVNEGAAIRKMEGGRIVRLSFSETSSYEPVIGNVILKYKTPVNILFADMKNLKGVAKGQMIVELPSDPKIAEEMAEYFKERNVGVEEWKENVD